MRFDPGKRHRLRFWLDCQILALRPIVLPVSRCVLLPTGSIQAGRLPCAAMITRELEAHWRRESIVAFDIFAMHCLIPDEAKTEEETLGEIEG